MNIEEFIKLGCLRCGGHEFHSSGPIQHDGPTEIDCALCGASFNREQVGELDSLTWEIQRAGFEGTPEPKALVTEYYKDKNQFVQDLGERDLA